MSAMGSPPTPLFKHPRLMAAALLAVLAFVNGAALYVRPLSGGATVAKHTASPEVLSALFPSRI